jgi:hypothetical protein
MTTKITTPGGRTAAKPKASSVTSPAVVRPAAPPAPKKNTGELRDVCGAKSDEFNMQLLDQALVSMAGVAANGKATTENLHTAVAAMEGVKPADVIEGMIAAQMFAAHNATMDAYRRVGCAGQPHEVRMALINAASKCSRTFVTLYEGLNKGRGKGSQVVRVEHVTVNAGGQAIVGVVGGAPGGRNEFEKRGTQPHAKPLAALSYADAPIDPLRSADTERVALPIPRDA